MTIMKEGALASFYTVNKAPIKHLRVYFSPKQAGEGDPSPSNIRSISGWNKIKFYHTGKNLFNKDEIISGYYISNGNSIANEHCGYLYIDIHNLSSITISGCYNNSAARFSFYTQNMTYISSSQQRPRTLTVPNNAYYLSVSAIIDTTLSQYDLNTIQVEAGDTTTTYESFQNQIPIEFPGIGKNIVDDSLRYYQANSFVLGTNQNIKYPTYLEAGTYRITVFGYNNTYAFVQEKNSNTWITVFENDTTGTFTITNNNYYRLMLLTTTTAEISNITHVMVSKGTEVQNNYEPFNNTVYGGYVDIANGELVQEWNSIIIDGVTTNRKVNAYYSDDTYIIGGIVWLTPSGRPDNQIVPTYVLCDNMPVLAPSNNLETIPSVRTIGAGSQYLRFYLGLISEHTELDTKQKRQNFCNEYFQAHPTQIVYKLSTPITYKLTPTQLSTLIGQNNIWSNADRVEVEYDLAESNDELYRRRNIILSGYPHIETVSGDIAHFQTDMIAPLKEAKIYFNPIQEGSGDPSPENVREISGWNEINILSSPHMEKVIFKNLDNAVVTNGTAVFNDNGSITITGTGEGACNIYCDIEPITINNSIDAVFSGSKERSLPASKCSIRLLDSNDSAILTTIVEGSNFYGDAVAPVLLPENTSFISDKIRITCTRALLNITLAPFYTETKNTITSELSSIANNIYGGYIDLINGELVQTHKKYKVSDFTWGKSSRGKMFMVDPANIDLFKTTRIISNTYKSIGGIVNLTSLNDLEIGNYNYVNNSKIYGRPALRDDRFSTANAFAEAMKDTEIIIELETPIHYQLSPQTLKTLKGTNNIWSNANGPIEVQYWTH